MSDVAYIVVAEAVYRHTIHGVFETFDDAVHAAAEVSTKWEPSGRRPEPLVNGWHSFSIIRCEVGEPVRDAPAIAHVHRDADTGVITLTRYARPDPWCSPRRDPSQDVVSEVQHP